jgi:hypothetical protein
VAHAHRHLYTVVLALIGALAPLLAGLRTLEARVWRSAARWIADAEALARRALFAEAAVMAAGRTHVRGLHPLPAAPPPGGARRDGPATFRLPFARRAVRVRPDTHIPAAPPGFDVAPLARRIAALRALCVAPDEAARRLARRLARRRAELPAFLRRLRRRPAHAALRAPLHRLFAEPPESLVGAARATSGADPPAHIALIIDNPPSFPRERMAPARARPLPAPLSREFARASAASPLGAGGPKMRRRPL